MTLREQIEALPEPHAWGECVKVAAVFDIIDQHEKEDAALRERLAYLEKWKDDRNQDALWAEEQP